MMYHGTEVGNFMAVSSEPLLINLEKLTDGAVILKLKNWKSKRGESAWRIRRITKRDHYFHFVDFILPSVKVKVSRKRSP